jgi:outer membrane lipoprotein-sorting protein
MTLTRKLAILGCCLGLLGAARPAPAWSAEFSARMLVKDGPKSMPGKVLVQDGKMRQEFTDATGQTITIVRPDKKVVWVIIPWQRSYLEMPLRTKLPGQFIQIPPQATQKRLVGKATVNGYDTERYEVSVPGGAGLVRQTFWVAPKLGLPIKTECRERQFAVEYQDIKEGKVPDRLFELPVGYQKLPSHGGFADRVD